LQKDEIPYINAVSSANLKINGISEKDITSLATANIHTQAAFIRLVQSGKFGDATAKLTKLVKTYPEVSFYLTALTAVNKDAAEVYVAKALNSNNEEVKNQATKLAANFGSDFAPALIKAFMAKGEITKAEVKLAKSMIHPAKANEVTALWNNLSPTLTIAFIEMTNTIRHDSVAEKTIAATQSNDSKVKKAAQKALKYVVSAKNLSALSQSLAKESNSTAIRYIQAGLASSIAQSDKSTVAKIAQELAKSRNDKLLVAFAKSNRIEVLPLLKKDILSGDTNIQKNTIKSLSSMAPELSTELLTLAIEKISDERNKILAVRSLTAAVSRSTEPVTKKKSYFERALKSKVGTPEATLLKNYLQKLSPKKKKKNKTGPTNSEAAYSPLFHGKDLSQWDNKGDYKVQEGVIYGTKGNLWSKKSYKNFSLKFEFKLHPGTNSGLAIRTPKGQKPIELQIIDNPHPKYTKIKDYQRHGSLYSYVAAKTGFLKKTGEWNQQEVICNGTQVTVILNGTTILEADLSKVKPVEGSRYKIKYINEATEGLIGFLGHRTPVELRKIAIKEL
ncbi:MAG: DUF1080 domain-containing protein, partial [Lentisphaeraceae bacterium]|nr:DUF1080 domain-containing protein [Lentisphaeraceae bacterium]